MIDLPLMLRLFEATPPACQILLLGDPDQLASVDVGSALRDLIEASAHPASPLHGKVERLTRTYRFREDSAIYQICQYARQGDDAAFAALLQSNPSDLDFHPLAPDTNRLPDTALRAAIARHRLLAAAPTPEAALALVNDSIILCPTRSGPLGSVACNAAAIHRIQIDHALAPNSLPTATPVIVLENDYELELFNGDLGIAWNPSGAPTATHCYFPGPDGAPRRFALSSLPRHEPAFALTIHKSQGSEFNETIVLVGPSGSHLLSRELLYTAFSRAKQRLRIIGDPATLRAAIARQAHRATRLASLLLS